VFTIVALSHDDTAALKRYAEIPMLVESDRIIRCEPIEDGTGGFSLKEEAISPSFSGVFPDNEECPIPLHGRWDISDWGIFAAIENDAIVGGCVVAIRTPQVYMLEGRTDMAVLWDIRVRSGQKHNGIGTALFHAAVDFSREKRCGLLKIETQNVNATACNFYRDQGCRLRGLNMNSYSDYPEEVQLLWYLEL
jgi:GNAT superfamily N-acetyltransferase